MKYPESQFNELVKGLKVLISFYGITDIDKCLKIGMLHDLHFRVYANYTYLINNPNVQLDSEKKRILELNPDYKLYPDGCNDNHIETAMKKAIKIVFS